MDKIGMGVICKNCGKVVLEHFIGDLCPTQFKPATPVPTQSSEVGPYKTVPSISCPGFYTLQENRINIFGPAKLRECHDYMAFARKGFALGQSTARSQERRVRKWKAGEGPYHLGAWYNAEEGTEEETIEGPGFPKGIDSFELTNEILNIAYAQGLAAKEAEFEKINVRLMKAEAELAKATDRWEKLADLVIGSQTHKG